MKRWFAFAEQQGDILEWDTITRQARWMRHDGTVRCLSSLTLVSVSARNDEEIFRAPWHDPDLELPEGL